MPSILEWSNTWGGSSQYSQLQCLRVALLAEVQDGHTRSRVAKVWFESAPQLYHGKFNYDRRWKLLFRNYIVLFCQSRDIYISKARKKSCLLKWKSARYSTEPSAGQPLCLCWCSLMIKHYSCFRFNVEKTVWFRSSVFKAHLFLIKATFNERRKHLLTKMFLPLALIFCNDVKLSIFTLG